MCLDPISIFGSVNPGVLQTATGVIIDGTIRFITDQLGNSSILGLSTSAVNIGSGTITNNGTATIKGAGSNILSLRSSANAEVGSFSNGGGFTAAQFFTGAAVLSSNTYYVSNGGGMFIGYGGGGGNLNLFPNSGTAAAIICTTNGAVIGSGATSAFPMLKNNGSALQVKNGDNTLFSTIEPLEILTEAPSGGTAKKIKFGEQIPVTEAALTALGINSQWLVEIDAVNYYFLGSNTQFA